MNRVGIPGGLQVICPLRTRRDEQRLDAVHFLAQLSTPHMQRCTAAPHLLDARRAIYSARAEMHQPGVAQPGHTQRCTAEQTAMALTFESHSAHAEMHRR